MSDVLEIALRRALDRYSGDRHALGVALGMTEGSAYAMMSKWLSRVEKGKPFAPDAKYVVPLLHEANMLAVDGDVPQATRRDGGADLLDRMEALEEQMRRLAELVEATAGPRRRGGR